MVLACRWRSAGTEQAPPGSAVTCPCSQSLAGEGSGSDYSGPSPWREWASLSAPQGLRAPPSHHPLCHAHPFAGKCASFGCARRSPLLRQVSWAERADTGSRLARRTTLARNRGTSGAEKPARRCKRRSSAWTDEIQCVGSLFWAGRSVCSIECNAAICHAQGCS